MRTIGLKISDETCDDGTTLVENERKLSFFAKNPHDACGVDQS